MNSQTDRFASFHSHRAPVYFICTISMTERERDQSYSFTLKIHPFHYFVRSVGKSRARCCSALLEGRGSGNRTNDRTTRPNPSKLPFRLSNFVMKNNTERYGYTYPYSILMIFGKECHATAVSITEDTRWVRGRAAAANS